MLNHRRRLTLRRLTAAPTATSSAYVLTLPFLWHRPTSPTRVEEACIAPCAADVLFAVHADCVAGEDTGLALRLPVTAWAHPSGLAVLRALVRNYVVAWPVLRVFPPCALISHAQGSSGAVATVPIAWRGHTKRLTTTRARPGP